MAHRDIGSSIFQAKSGARRASKELLARFGLTIKLHKNALLGWTAGFAMFGAMMAIIVNDFQDTFENNEQFQQFLAQNDTGGSFTEIMISAMFPMIAAMLSGYVVTAMIRVSDEENSGRIEYLMGTALSRLKWLSTHIVFVLFGIFLTLSTMGLAGAFGYALASDPSSTLTPSEVYLAAIVSVPAMVLFMSVILFIFSVIGRFVKAFAWAFYAYIALIGSFANIFTWPTWVQYASPFQHTPQYPTSNFDWLPIIVMSSLSVIVVTASFLLFKHRDISLK